MIIRPIQDQDRDAIRAFIIEHWGGSKMMISRGRILYPAQSEGFIADSAERRDASNDPSHWLGLITFQIEGEACEVLSVDSFAEGIGIGGALLQAVVNTAQEAKCTRVWLITTNDNLNALRFYQKRGFALVAVYPNALAYTRKLKPQVPLIGLNGIPLRDELELEMRLNG